MRNIWVLVIGLKFLLLPPTLQAQETVSRFETFDRYDPTYQAYPVKGLDGEHIDTRTLGLSWEVTDFTIPGDGGLDIEISRSFNKLSHTPSDMGHWYFGVPRIQVPTSPWRGPYDPANPYTETFFAAWNNLYARLNYGSASICENAGRLVDQSVTGSINQVVKGGIFFAAPIVLFIPGEGSKILLERSPDANQFPADVRYVTTDNWIARCLPPDPGSFWGGFEVVSPTGTRYTFNFIQYMVPGDYALNSSGGWVEMGISHIEDVHGNFLDYRYDLDSGGSDLLASIEASDGRVVSIDYYSGSRLGVDVQGSPLSLISAINVHANGSTHSIRYEYCDFADYYILKWGCPPVELSPDGDLPVLHEVVLPEGLRTRYRYHPSIYSANVALDWGGFEFQLRSVTLPTGGMVTYDYRTGYSPILQQTNSPAPRLAKRTTSGRSVATGVWSYGYAFSDHIESTTVTGPDRQEGYEFYEGLGTYEFRIARYPGQHEWPSVEPTDYDEVMGQLRRHTIKGADGNETFLTTDYEYAHLPFIGRQYYSGNWLGWPTLVLAQIRPLPVSRVAVQDLYTSEFPQFYSSYTDPAEFDIFAFPLSLTLEGVDATSTDGRRTHRIDHEWLHRQSPWLVGLPDRVVSEKHIVDYEYYPGSGLVSSLTEDGIRTDFQYDQSGNRTAESWLKEGLRHTRRFEQFHRGRPGLVAEPVDPDQGVEQITRYSIDDFGRMLWQENSQGQRISRNYDALGRVTELDVPDTLPVQIDHQLNAAGELTRVVVLQADRQRSIELDGFGRGILILDYPNITVPSAPIAVSYAFSDSGLLSFSSLPYEYAGTASQLGNHYEYDALRRAIRIVRSPSGLSKRYCYSWRCLTPEYVDWAGNLANGFLFFDEEGNQSGYEFASVGSPGLLSPVRIVQQSSSQTLGQAPAFRETLIHRDGSGNITSVSQGAIDDQPTLRSYAYEYSRLIGESHPETGESVYTYDERGNRTSSVIVGSYPVRYRYDGLNRLTAVDYQGDEDDIYFRYNDAGLRSETGNGHAIWFYSYDGAKRLIAESLQVGGELLSLDYDYDGSGNRSNVRYPSGLDIDFRPNGFGWPTGAGALADDADYWPDGSLRGFDFGNGVRASFELTAEMFPSRRVFDGVDGSLIAGFDYQYDGSGFVAQIDDLQNQALGLSLSYDGIGRMVRADGIWGTDSFSYDAGDNILVKSLAGQAWQYQYDTRNRLSSVTVANAYNMSLNYDVDGNVVHFDYYDYLYNPALQLTGIAQIPDLGYQYDGNGNRVITSRTEGNSYSLYDLGGRLMYQDSCSAGGQVSEFVYLAQELVGRVDSECEPGCHP